MKNQNDYERLTIRIPPDLLTRLKKLSTLNERSVNSEVIHLLTKSVMVDDAENNIEKSSILRTAKEISKLSNKLECLIMDANFKS